MNAFLERLKNLAPYQRNRIIVGGVVFILLIIVIVAVVNSVRNEEPTPQRVTLTFWDVFDDENAYFEIIQKFRVENPFVDIKFERKQYDTYYEDLTKALAEGEGPDVYLIHNTWLPFEQKRLISLDEASPEVNSDLLISNFPDVVRFDFTREDTAGNQKLYALPLSIDTLGLFYNKDYFNSANLPVPPQTWDDFVEFVKKLRVLENGNIKFAGAAFGGGENVNRAMDILSVLMLQTGTTMNDPVSNLIRISTTTTKDGIILFPARDALRFYTSFSDPASDNYTWNPKGHYSIDAFSQSEAAMMINYSYHISTVRGKNSNLNLAVAPLPQPKDRIDKINYASYWGLAVSKASKSPSVAWDFITFLTKEENAKIYLNKTQRPPALKSLITSYAGSELEVFANQILSAKSWMQPDSFAIEPIFVNGIESAVNKKDALDAIIRDMELKMNILFSK